MTQPPEIVVTQRSRHPQVRGCGAGEIVDLRRSVEGRAFLDLQHHVERAGRHARAQLRRHPMARRLVHRDHVALRSEEHTSKLQSLMRTSYAVFCLNKKNNSTRTTNI